jgi:hypothetical protein
MVGYQYAQHTPEMPSLRSGIFFLRWDLAVALLWQVASVFSTHWAWWVADWLPNATHPRGVRETGRPKQFPQGWEGWEKKRHKVKGDLGLTQNGTVCRPLMTSTLVPTQVSAQAVYINVALIKSFMGSRGKILVITFRNTMGTSWECRIDHPGDIHSGKFWRWKKRIEIWRYVENMNNHWWIGGTDLLNMDSCI